MIGILQIEQKGKRKAERNDRLFAVPRRSHSELALRDVQELSKPIQEELEKFFIATDELEAKSLEIIGWKGAKTAQKAIQAAAKAFAKGNSDRSTPQASTRRFYRRPFFATEGGSW